MKTHKPQLYWNPSHGPTVCVNVQLLNSVFSPIYIVMFWKGSPMSSGIGDDNLQINSSLTLLIKNSMM